MHRRPEGVQSWFFCNESGGALSADVLLRLAKCWWLPRQTKGPIASVKSSRRSLAGCPSSGASLRCICRRYRDCMDVEQLVEDYIPDAERKDVGIEAECPNRFGTEDLGDGRSSSGHSNEEGGRKLFAVNAEHSDCGAAAIMCQHATCTDDLSFADFVWLIMQEGGLHLLEDLKDYAAATYDDEFEKNGDKLLPKVRGTTSSWLCNGRA